MDVAPAGAPVSTNGAPAMLTESTGYGASPTLWSTTACTVSEPILVGSNETTSGFARRFGAESCPTPLTDSANGPVPGVAASAPVRRPVVAGWKVTVPESVA